MRCRFFFYLFHLFASGGTITAAKQFIAAELHAEIHRTLADCLPILDLTDDVRVRATKSIRLLWIEQTSRLHMFEFT